MSYYNEGNFNFPNSTYEIDEFKQNYFGNSNENNVDCLCPCHYENRIVEQNVNLNSNNSTCISGEDGFKNNFIYEMQELRERNKKLNDDLINLSNVKNSADAYIKELEKENFRLNQIAKDDKQRENDLLKNDINRYRDMLDEALFFCGKVGDVSGINVKNDLDYYVNNKNDYDKMITSLIDWIDRLKGNNANTNMLRGKFNEYDSGIYNNTNDIKQQPQMKAFNSSGNFNRVNDDVYKINDGMMYGTNNNQKGFNYMNSNDVNNRMNKGNEEISMRTTKFDMINNKINNIKQTTNPNSYNSNVQQLSENKGQVKQYGNNNMNNQVMMNKPISNYDQLQQQNQMKAKASVISNNNQDIKPVTSNNNQMMNRPNEKSQLNNNQQPLNNVQNQNKQYQYNPIMQSKQMQLNKNQPLQEKKQVNKSFDVNTKQPKQFNSNDVHYLSYYPNNNNDEDAFIAHSKDKPKQSHLNKSTTNPNTQNQQIKKPNDITTQSEHYSRINNKINNINNRIETYKEKHHIYRNVNPKSTAPSKQSQSHSQVKTVHKPRVKPAFDVTNKKENYKSNNTNDYEFQGPCFACEVGCNVSNTGYSPMTFSPYNPGYRRRSVTPLKMHSRSSSQKRV